MNILHPLWCTAAQELVHFDVIVRRNLSLASKLILNTNSHSQHFPAPIGPLQLAQDVSNSWDPN